MAWRSSGDSNRHLVDNLKGVISHLPSWDSVCLLLFEHAHTGDSLQYRRNCHGRCLLFQEMASSSISRCTMLWDLSTENISAEGIPTWTRPRGLAILSRSVHHTWWGLMDSATVLQLFIPWSWCLLASLSRKFEWFCSWMWDTKQGVKFFFCAQSISTELNRRQIVCGTVYFDLLCSTHTRWSCWKSIWRGTELDLWMLGQEVGIWLPAWPSW